MYIQFNKSAKTLVTFQDRVFLRMCSQSLDLWKALVMPSRNTRSLGRLFALFAANYPVAARTESLIGIDKFFEELWPKK